MIASIQKTHMVIYNGFFFQLSPSINLMGKEEKKILAVKWLYIQIIICTEVLVLKSYHQSLDCLSASKYGDGRDHGAWPYSYRSNVVAKSCNV